MGTELLDSLRRAFGPALIFGLGVFTVGSAVVTSRATAGDAPAAVEAAVTCREGERVELSAPTTCDPSDRGTEEEGR